MVGGCREPSWVSYTTTRKERAMAVKVRINDREFLLTWEQFEKCFYRATTCLEVLDVFNDSKAANF